MCCKGKGGYSLSERRVQVHVLQVERPARAGKLGKQREQGVLDLVACAPGHEHTRPFAGHEKLCLGALAAPRLAVSVEDAGAEDVEDGPELGALGVVGKVGGEDVARVGRVRVHEEPHAGARRAGEAEGEGVGGEDAGDPVVQMVEVGEEGGEHAQQRPVHWVLSLGPDDAQVLERDGEAARKGTESSVPLLFAEELRELETSKMDARGGLAI